MSPDKSSKKISFNSRFFQKKDFSRKTILKYFRNAVKDIKIAFKNKEPEIIFRFSYSALIKTGIALIASYNYRIRSGRGHHVQLIKKLSQILKNEDIRTIGNKMRRKRNLELYGVGTIVSEKEATFFKKFVRKSMKKAKSYLKSQDSLT